MPNYETLRPTPFLMEMPQQVSHRPGYPMGEDPPTTRSLCQPHWLKVTPFPGLGPPDECPSAHQVVASSHSRSLRMEPLVLCVAPKSPWTSWVIIPLHAAFATTTFFETLFRHALLSPELEKGRGMEDHSHSQTRPADILVPSWSMGKAATCDVIHST